MCAFFSYNVFFNEHGLFCTIRVYNSCCQMRTAVHIQCIFIQCYVEKYVEITNNNTMTTQFIRCRKSLHSHNFTCWALKTSVLDSSNNTNFFIHCPKRICKWVICKQWQMQMQTNYVYIDGHVVGVVTCSKFLCSFKSIQNSLLFEYLLPLPHSVRVCKRVSEYGYTKVCIHIEIWSRAIC